YNMDVFALGAPSPSRGGTGSGKPKVNLALLSGWRLGGYAGLVDVEGDRLWAGGLEGQTMLSSQLQLDGRVGFFSAEGTSAASGFVGINFFPIDNFRANLHGWVTSGDGDTATGIGGILQYQIGGSPFSLFVTADRFAQSGASDGV